MTPTPTHPELEADQRAPWYRRAFQRRYLDLYAHRNRADAERAMRFMRRRLPIDRRLRLLDLCCGAGRHLSLIAPEVGFAVGIDLSRDLLRSARASSRNGGGEGELVEGDMRALPFRAGAFGAVVNLFTSFGYFADDEENLGALGEVARVLARGGAFLLDHINRAHLERTLQPSSERTLEDGTRLVERRVLEADSRRINKTVEWVDTEGGAMRWNESVRLYGIDEMRGLLDRVGMSCVEVFGDFDERAFDEDSPRMIVLAQRLSA